MIGSPIGNFRVIEKLGEGGMGVVFKALDVQLDRPVAIKMLNADLARNPELVQRFRTEARAQANLNHPNVATLYAFIIDQGNAFIVMEFVEGETFDQIIRRSGPMNPRDAVPWFKQALLGIGAAHRMGIIHRDIKPSNLMVNRQGVVKVMDFGIAKAVGTPGTTRTGMHLGTLAYMSPEQIQSRPVDVRSDIYALGITLYEMLSGHVPFESASDFQIMQDHVMTPPPPLARFCPHAPREFDAVLAKALAKNPDQRFQAAEEFGAALERPDRLASAPPIVIAPPIVVAPPPRAPEGNRQPIASASSPVPPPPLKISVPPPPVPARPGSSGASAAAAMSVDVACAWPAPDVVVPAVPPPKPRRVPVMLIIIGAAAAILLLLLGVLLWPSQSEGSQRNAQMTPPPAPTPQPSLHQDSAETVPNVQIVPPSDPGPQPSVHQDSPQQVIVTGGGESQSAEQSGTPFSAAAGDLSGQFSGTVHNNSLNLSAEFGLIIRDDDGALSGCMLVVHPLGGSGPLRGFETGNRVSFSVISALGTIDFAGSRQGAAMDGSYTVRRGNGPAEDGTFAVRKTRAEGVAKNFDPARCPTDAELNK